MKIATIVGARPQFIKSASVSTALAELGCNEFKIHTGQHYDHEMSQVFFNDLGLHEPEINLGIGSGTHAEQTGQMLIELEPVLMKHKPDIVLVYGDTNSTLAGALAAAKLNINLAHIEAGLRSYNRQMPEEVNRVLTDHCSSLLFCPTQTAVDNLSREGIKDGVNLVGDTMYDAVLKFGARSNQESQILNRLGLQSGKYLLVTIHRANNTDHFERLTKIFKAFQSIDETIVFPIHPRTKRAIESYQLALTDNIILIDPVGYLDMLMLEMNSKIVLTDSGGIQKEAFFFGVPCLTLRDETEWVETAESGWNKIVGVEPNRIVEGIRSSDWPNARPFPFFGDGNAGSKIARLLLQASTLKCRID